MTTHEPWEKGALGEVIEHRPALRSLPEEDWQALKSFLRTTIAEAVEAEREVKHTIAICPHCGRDFGPTGRRRCQELAQDGRIERRDGKHLVGMKYAYYRWLPPSIPMQPMVRVQPKLINVRIK